MIKFIEDKELCIKLKEKGFDEGCILQFRGGDTQPISQMGYELNYEKNSQIGDETNYWLACPAYWQVIEWLRDKKNVIISVLPERTNGLQLYYQFAIYKLETEGVYGVGIVASGYDFTNYNNALSEAIEEALKLI